MTINGAIMELVMLRENPDMPYYLKASLDKVIETISEAELVEPKDEPQACSVNGRPYSECADCEYFKCTADEPQMEGSSE